MCLPVTRSWSGGNAATSATSAAPTDTREMPAPRRRWYDELTSTTIGLGSAATAVAAQKATTAASPRMAIRLARMVGLDLLAGVTHRLELHAAVFSHIALLARRRRRAT